MSFSESLKEYMQVASLSVTRLAEMSGLSASSISRYLNDKQVPGEAAILSMSKALSSSLSDVEDGPNKDEIYSRLYKAAFGTEADYDSCIPKLKELLSALRVGNNDLARALSYDASYISRILSGSRKPSSLPQFLSDVSEYLARRFHDTSRATTIMNAVGLDSEASDPEELSDAILSWLGQPRAKETPQIAHFLGKLDEFDLNEFMASIKFDEIKVPTMPFQLPGSKTYTGISEMMQAELDFLKFAVLSKSKEDVILYSDMPLDEMSKDEEFPKKWMMGMALLIRKGLSLQMIHDVHRPLNEMLLGLEGWIPMYMTGQVHPYYLHTDDGRDFIYLNENGEDDFSSVRAVRLENGAAADLGDFTDSLSGRYLENPENFRTTCRVDLFGTYSAYRYCRVGDDGKPAAIDSLYDCQGNQRILRAKSDVQVQVLDTPGGSVTGDGTVSAGAYLYFQRTDGSSFVDFMTSEGQAVRIKTDTKDTPHTTNGTDESELFDGLMYAG